MDQGISMRRSPKLAPWLCLLLGCVGMHADAGALRLGKKGVEIDGGSMGTFLLAYPKVATKAAPGRYEAAIEQRAKGGQVVLKYAGVTVAVSLEEGGKIAYRFSGDRDAIKGFRVGELMVPFSYTDGGTWRIGGADARPFPREKPAKPLPYCQETRCAGSIGHHRQRDLRLLAVSARSGYPAPVPALPARPSATVLA